MYAHTYIYIYIYRKTSNIRHTLVGNKIVDQSDVVGASPVGAAPETYIRDLTVYIYIYIYVYATYTIVAFIWHVNIVNISHMQSSWM